MGIHRLASVRVTSCVAAAHVLATMLAAKKCVLAGGSWPRQRLRRRRSMLFRLWPLAGSVAAMFVVVMSRRRRWIDDGVSTSLRHRPRHAFRARSAHVVQRK